MHRNTSLLKRAAAIAAVGLALTLSPATAQAAPAVTVTGQVTCINSSVVGVWIQAETSKSGWASWSVPIVGGGHNKANYSFRLDKGGRYQVHVGCGGSSKRWGLNLKSLYTSGTKNNFVCNDIHPALLVAFKRLPWVFARFIDLSNGVPYQTCARR